MGKKKSYLILSVSVLSALALTIGLTSCSKEDDLVRISHDAALCAGLPEDQAIELGKNVRHIDGPPLSDLRFPKGSLVQINPAKAYPKDCVRIVDYTPFSVEELHIKSTPYYSSAPGTEMVQIPASKRGVRWFVVSVTD